MGGSVRIRRFSRRIQGGQICSTLAAPLTEYTSEDVLNLEKGKALYELSPLEEDFTWLKNIDMKRQIPDYSVPVCFLAGRFDNKTPSQLVEEYYLALELPQGNH